MSDYILGNKLEAIMEQNKEIISLMKMQMIVANPDVDFYELNNKVRIAVHEAQARQQADREKYLARRERENKNKKSVFVSKS